MNPDKLGKVDHHVFETFIRSRCGAVRQEVGVGPAFGVDVAVVDLPGDLAIAITSDPLSLIPALGLEESAWLSVHLMVNDMATTGFAPMYGQFVLNLPSTFSKEDFSTYWDHIHQFCSRLGVAVTGGHTGFIEGQNSTIAGGGTMITVGSGNKMLVSSSAMAGDILLVTKTCAMSSAAILAMSFPQTVINACGKDVYQQACASFYQTSSLDDARLAVGYSREFDDVTAMHDVTEGGILGAIYEMAVASGNGVRINNELIPVGEVQREVCKAFSLDPRFCIGAGSMIISCRPGSEHRVASRLRDSGIDCTIVGHLVPHDDGRKLTTGEITCDLPYFAEDPYWAAFFTALESGWR